MAMEMEPATGEAAAMAATDPTGSSCRILVVDNYDSFVYTIIGYLEQMGAECIVVRNDAVPETSSGAPDLSGFDGVLISPGPGNPLTAGRSLDVIGECARTSTPMFGVCLGLQCLGHYFGATVTHAPQLMHGKTSLIHHEGQGPFASLPSPFQATRYHSLAVVPDTVDEAVLEITARADDGSIQGLSHRSLPLHSVQFHPESVLTNGGHTILAHFLELAEGRDGTGAGERARTLAPLLTSAAPH